MTRLTDSLYSSSALAAAFNRLVVALSLALATAADAGAQQPTDTRYLPVGLFIGAIEEGARIFTPTRLLPFEHPEAQGHQFPQVHQLHGGEDQLLVLIGQAAGLHLEATLQRYPTQPDSVWPYAPSLPPPVDEFRAATVITRPMRETPLPGLRVVAVLNGAPIAFIIDTRGLSLAARHMQRATATGLDIDRGELLVALAHAAQAGPPRGAAVLVYAPQPF